SAGDLNVAAYVIGGDRATRGGEVHAAADLLDSNRSRSGRNFYRTAQIADVLCAGSNVGLNLGFVGDLNLVANGDVAHPGKIFADAIRVASLLVGGFDTISSKRF